MDSRPLAIVGAHGSPYSRKLRAVLRYRRIPHRWIHQGAPESIGLPEPRVALLPRLLLPDDTGRVEARTDSTPLILELEPLGPRSGRREGEAPAATRLRPDAVGCRAGARRPVLRPAADRAPRDRRLERRDRGVLSDILAGTGCDPLFASDPERSKTAGRTD